MTTEERISKNSERCSANKELEFRGAVTVPAVDRYGNDYTRLDLLFNDGIEIKLFDPKKSIRDRGTLSGRLGALCEALNLDFNDVPPCKGGWVEFVGEVCDMVNYKKLTKLYAKLTVTEAGWIELGEGRCFSLEPDMEYTDSDKRFLANVEIIAPNTNIGNYNLPPDMPRVEKVTKKVVKEVVKRPVERKHSHPLNSEVPGERIKPMDELPDWGALKDDLGEDTGMATSYTSEPAIPVEKSVFDEFLEKREAEAKKPEWVEEEAAAHAAKKPRQSRAKKKKVEFEPIEKAEGGEIGHDDLPF